MNGVFDRIKFSVQLIRFLWKRKEDVRNIFFANKFSVNKYSAHSYSRSLDFWLLYYKYKTFLFIQRVIIWQVNNWPNHNINTAMVLFNPNEITLKFHLTHNMAVRLNSEDVHTISRIFNLNATRLFIHTVCVILYTFTIACIFAKIQTAFHCLCGV